MSEANDHLLHQYFHGYGKQHVDAEQRLRVLGPNVTLATPAAAIDEADPVVPLMRSVLTTLQTEQGVEMDAALAHMDQQADRYEGTQAMHPRPDVLASDLEYEHGARAVPYLSVRLMKQPEWPDWKVAAVLQYLANSKDERALPALARFAAESRNPGHARMIANTLQAFDPSAMALAQRKEEQYRSKVASRRSTPSNASSE